jgi:hypothetical protein
MQKIDVARPVLSSVDGNVHNTADWNTSNPDANDEFALYVMVVFERYSSPAPSDFSTRVFASMLTYPLHIIKHLPFKTKFQCGELLFSSTTRQCFSSSVSAETVVMSKLFNKTQTVPAGTAQFS